jgi:hypothetical protein
VQKIKPIGWIAIIAIAFLGFGWRSAHQEEEKARSTLHEVCEAARRSNEELLGHKDDLNIGQAVADAGKIVPELRRIFAAGCGSPIPTD